MYQYPTGQDGLQALIEQPSGDQNGRWAGPYVDPTNDLKDPWMNEYDLSFENINGNQMPVLRSAGPDGAMNTDDDVASTDEL